MNTSKIKSIRKVSCKKTPVYDISVPKYNNFVLGNNLVVHNCRPYQYLKSTIYEGRIQLLKSKRLIDELVDLERNINTGKVDHPPNGHKDAADALCGATFTASKYAEEFAYDYGESVDEMINLNINPQQNLLKQLTVDFEKELANMGPVLGNPNTKGKPPLATLDMFEDKQEKDYPSLEGNTLIW